jgi:hypothetical protein
MHNKKFCQRSELLTSSKLTSQGKGLRITQFKMGQSETPVAKIKISPVVLPLFYETMGSLKDGIF